MLRFLLISYFIVINVFGIQIMGNDKKRAQQRRQRVSERNLWLLAFVGGALGMTIGMNKYRHKTKHFTFKYGLPLLLIIDIVIFYLLLDRLS
ncbi:DUF1294 domain-containing protein [Bacillus sp. FSL K6-3431]|uniref:DUF1294 domain-containing protein n=1 Tax=Bacillus sp. FSL K6-3431 TaxID=2921500 RepID=UPI0030FA67BD